MTISDLARLILAAGFAALSLTACGSAQGPHPEAPPPGGKPPQEMLDACKDKKEGDACSSQSDRGEMKGTCAKAPDEKLICRPEGPPPGAPPGPPPGAQATK